MTKKTYFFSLFFLFFLVFLRLYSEEGILIRNGTIVPVTGKTIPNGCLLIENGKIAKIGTDIPAPPGAKIIDAKGFSVYPGLISSLTAVGVTGYPGSGDDLDELSISTAQMDPYDALNPEDDCIEVTRIGGVTTVLTISGTRNVIDGKSVVLNLEGNFAEKMVIKKYAAQIFNLGAITSDKYPTTRPGVISLIREKLNDCLRYLEMKKRAASKEKIRGEEEREEWFKTSLEMEALAPVLNREVPALFITNDEVTIRNALQLAKEYNLRGILFASADILKFAEQLAQEKIPVIWAGTQTIPKQWEPYDLNYHTAAVLAANGILFALEQYGWGPESRNVRNLVVPASLSVAHGLSEEEAIRAITINPAKIFGVDDQVGSLEVGKIANLVIWNGSPIQMRSRVQTVIINGKVIQLESVQTRLRDKFERIIKDRMNKK